MINSKIKLDHLGQFYAAARSMDNPGTFSIGAHLKEPIDPATLQRAVNDIMRRLPHLNVRQVSGFFQHHNKILANYPKIRPQGDYPTPCSCFIGQDHLLRILYGTRHFTLEVQHSVCDGRSLAMAAASLLIRYFELMGVSVVSEGFINVNDAAHIEETEDAYARHADLRKSKSKSKSEHAEDVFIPDYQAAAARIMVYKIDLAQLKQQTKALGVTITEYILAHIFSGFAKLRSDEGCNNMGITCTVPIDCRSYFPTKSLRNFVSHKVVKMLESPEFGEVAHDIRNQLAKITPEYIQDKISEPERLLRLGRFVPLPIKKLIICHVGHSLSAGCTTGFSNLGYIKLPDEVRHRLDMLSFALGPEPNMPYQFACVAAGNVLTLTATTIAKDTEIADKIAAALGSV